MSNNAPNGQRMGAEMQILWVVAQQRGLKLVVDPNVDVFDSLEEARDEAINRGPEYRPIMLNKDDVIETLLRQNQKLIEENKKLRSALDSDPNFLA